MEKYFGAGGALSRVLENFRHRPGQAEMAGAVAETLEKGGVLLVEAGTGVGKTLAYLVPAVLSGMKVAVSTGTKNLQEQLIEKDIPILEKLFPGRFRAAVMKGRGNYLCKRRFKNFAQQPLFREGGEAKFFSLIQDWAMKTATGDRAEIEGLPDDYAAWGEMNSKSELCLGQACPTFSSCFITRMRAEAAVADIVVVNHHLFFADLNVREAAFGEVIPRCDAVIFDEAHHVEETSMGYFGKAISNHRVADAVRDAERELRSAGLSDPDAAALLANLARRSQEFFDPLRGAGGRRRLTEKDVEAVSEKSAALLNTFSLVSDFLASTVKGPDAVKNLSMRFSELAELLSEILSLERDDHVYWVESRGWGVFLQSTPIEVSKILRERLYPAFESIILTSATLTTGGGFGFMKSRLGLEDAGELRVPSPFDYERQTVFYAPDDLPPPSSPLFPSRAAERMREILTETNGRAFLLFTSYRNMEKVSGELAGRLPYPTLKQGESPRSVILKKFRDGENLVLFATTSFWQGVDVPGEALSAVIVDKLPFAPPDDPLTAAIIESIEKRGGSAFMEYQLPLAALMLKQGLGRLIRSETDTGLLAVLDGRLLGKSYGKIFLKSLPPVTVRRGLEDVKKDLRRLWGT